MSGARGRLIGAVALCALAAGCGSSEPAPSQRAAAAVRQTVRAALIDVARDDGRAFCGRLTPHARARLGRILYGYDCARLATMIGQHLWPAARTGLLHARVTRVAVRGATATVGSGAIVATSGALTGLLDDGGTPTRLVREHDGRWRIADPAAAR